eukprot:517712-Amphidinium_carterae.1
MPKEHFARGMGRGKRGKREGVAAKAKSVEQVQEVAAWRDALTKLASAQASSSSAAAELRL